MRIYPILLFFTLVLSACQNQSNETKVNPDQQDSKKKLSIKYSSYFEIYKTLTGFELIIKSPVNGQAQKFSLSTKPTAPNQIEIPCKKITALSSMYCSMLCALKASERIVAIDDIQYQTEAEIQARFAKGEIKAIQSNQQLDLEALLLLKPDLIIDYSNFYQNTNAPSLLEKAKIKKVLFHDYLESSPLARAEWIKVVGVFCNQYTLADSLFNVIASEYTAAKKIVAQVKSKKTIFCDTEFNGTWYVAGGKSYTAQLIADAGGAYIFSDDTSSGSKPKAFELVYTKAKMAEYWINVGQVQSKNELLKQNEKYAWFNAFKTNAIYNNNNKMNVHSGNAIWNKGVIEPQIVLKDLIKILYPELLKDHTFVYYQVLR